MKFYPLGIDYDTKEPLFEPIEQKKLQASLYEGLKENGSELGKVVGPTSKGVAFRGQVDAYFDSHDPHHVGWTFLINKTDPARNKIIEKLLPLAEFRGMDDPDSPLLFDNTVDWGDWIEEHYLALDMEDDKKTPHFVLIIGSPDQVPFQFQSLLDTMASVGRLDFDDLDDLDVYAKKIIDLETKTNPPVVTNETTFFGTNHGQTNRGIDATFFSHNYMIEPLSDYVENNIRANFTVKKFVEDNATKQTFLEALKTSKSALVYTASHGLGPTGKNSEDQERLTGAICCQNFDDDGIDGIITSDDIPKEAPFLHGAVFFQFACFGYGTPQQSDFEHWMLDKHGAWKSAQVIAKRNFISALPKTLLAKPNGPVAFIGHVDTAMLHGFDDPNDPYPLDDRWSPRIVPFKKVIEKLLDVQSVGLSMADMNMRYSFESNRLTKMYDIMKQNKIVDVEDFKNKLSERWISRTDAQNYMIFGDPAVYLRIGTPGFVSK